MYSCSMQTIDFHFTFLRKGVNLCKSQFLPLLKHHSASFSHYRGTNIHHNDCVMHPWSHNLWSSDNFSPVHISWNDKQRKTNSHILRLRSVGQVYVSSSTVSQVTLSKNIFTSWSKRSWASFDPLDNHFLSKQVICHTVCAKASWMKSARIPIV